MIYPQSVLWPLFMQVKFILISLQLPFSLLCLSLFFFLVASTTAAFPSPLCHLHSLPPSLTRSLPPSISCCFHPPSLSAVCLQMKRAACQFFIFLGSKVASQLPGDGDGAGGWGASQKVTFAQCACEKNLQRRGREEVKKERKSGKAGLDQLNDSTVVG